MKRKGNLYPQLISDENILKAIFTVNASHRWTGNHKLNKKVKWVEETLDERVAELRQIITDGFTPSEPRVMHRYDSNAKKWRDISQPRLYPDQYVHHILIQVLEPILMRGMDAYCCGSIKGRGAIYGVRAIKRWMKNDIKGTKWCLEMDIRHFYDSLKPEIVIERLKRLVKDYRVLDLAERCLKYGVCIGAYFSQWFANTVLQPLDVKIREGGISHYLRYIDNFTVFSKNKRVLRKAVKYASAWLKRHFMEIKGDWQIFKTKHRMPDALGYRYGHGYTLIRKHRLLNIKRQISSYYRQEKRVNAHFAMSLLSRIGGLSHCNCVDIRKRIVPRGLQKKLKDIVRKYQQEVLA